MITFGKVFCTKDKPNCNACPLRGECRHFASAFARSSTYVLVLVLVVFFGLVKLVHACLPLAVPFRLIKPCVACLWLGCAFWIDQARVMPVLPLTMPFGLIKFVGCLSWP